MSILVRGKKKKKKWRSGPDTGPNALQLVELWPNKRRTEKLILFIVYTDHKTKLDGY